MRQKILSDNERKVMSRYIAVDGLKNPITRSIARYARSSLERLRKDIDLIESFLSAYEKNEKNDKNDKKR